MAAPELKLPVVFHPESDGKPMAETEMHRAEASGAEMARLRGK